MKPQNCDLCGLPLRYGTVSLQVSGRVRQFCCFGCRQVYQVLMEATESPDPESFRGSEIYRRCADAGIIPTTVEDLQKRSGSKKSPEESEPVEAGQSTEITGEGVLSLELTVNGMWCPACAWVIEEGLRKSPGVEKAACRFENDRVRLSYNPVKTSPLRIIETIRKLGYGASRPGGDSEGGESGRALIRLGLTAFLTMNVMMLSFALYSGFFLNLSEDAVASLSWPILILASIVFIYGGAPIHRKAMAGVYMGSPGMEVLISLGATSAFAYSLYNWFAGSIHLYFDTACMLITLVLIGKAVEQWTRDKVQAQLGSIFALKPTKARICTEDNRRGRYVSAGGLAAGDVFRVDEQELIPADGRVVDGECLVDESALTGEARPVGKRQGGVLYGGTRVIGGSVRARATAVGGDSMIGQLIDVMDKALARKTGIESATDKWLRFFVPAVILLAVGTGGVCLASGLGFKEALIRAVTVMVISCPCALGVAVPLARVAGISLAGKKGILVHDFDAVEQIGSVDAMVFDKTGTLTRGSWELVDITAAEGRTIDEILAIAAGIEAHSSHYVGETIVRAAQERKLTPVLSSETAEQENGITGYAGKSRIRIGSAQFVGDAVEGVPNRSGNMKLTDDTVLSYVYMSIDDELSAVFRFGDALRESVPELISTLKRQGRKLAVVSGDGTETTQKIGRMLGVPDSYGDMQPRRKADFIAALKARGYCVAMVGDGINDAQALASADLGIAVHGGRSIGTEASDITLMGNNPDRILVFERLAHQISKTVRQNLWFTFLYNAVSIPVAMSGLLNPMVAAAAMMLSSLSVTGNTVLLSRRGGRIAERRSGREELPGRLKPSTEI